MNVQFTQDAHALSALRGRMHSIALTLPAQRQSAFFWYTDRDHSSIENAYAQLAQLKPATGRVLRKVDMLVQLYLKYNIKIIIIYTKPTIIRLKF
jgi:hypothetical protein